MEVVHSGAGSLTSHIPVTQLLICLELWPTCLGGPWPGALPRGIQTAIFLEMGTKKS